MLSIHPADSKRVIRFSSEKELRQVVSVEDFKAQCGAFELSEKLPKLDADFSRWMQASALLLSTEKLGTVLVTTSKARTELNLERLNSLLKGSGVDFVEFVASTAILQALSLPFEGAQKGKVEAHQSSKTIYDERVYELVEKGIELNASDIHFQMRNAGGESRALVKMRIDGELEVVENGRNPQKMHELIAAIFARSDLKSLAVGEGQFNVVRPLSSFIRLPELRNVELRFQSAPERYGVDAVIRILNFDGKIHDYQDLGSLGYLPDQQDMLVEYGHGPGGAVLFVGETGSGKTTVLNTVMATHPGVVNGTMYASTLEDPPEGRPPNVSQFAVARSADQGGVGDENPFVAGLRVRMRSDGDIIVIGEIRDSATAEMFAQLSMAGSKAMASLHAASAKGAYERLASSMMKMPFESLASEDTLGLTVFQKLPPKLCPHCRIPADKALSSDLGRRKLNTLVHAYGLSPQHLFVRNHEGCEFCRKGRKGVQVVAEMFAPTQEMRSHIARGDIPKAFLLWRRSRTAGFTEPGTQGKTAFEVALYFVNQGILGVDTLDEVIGRILSQEIVKGAKT